MACFNILHLVREALCCFFCLQFLNGHRFSCSNTLTAEWCKAVLQEAVATFGKPEIVNSDQGAQYTSAAWLQYLEQAGIQVSMDGKGRATDNIWIERFWKSLKYDYVYLNPMEDQKTITV